MTQKTGFWEAMKHIFSSWFVWFVLLILVVNMSDIIAAYRAPTKLDQRVKVLEEKVKRLEKERAEVKVAPPGKSIY